MKKVRTVKKIRRKKDFDESQEKLEKIRQNQRVSSRNLYLPD